MHAEFQTVQWSAQRVPLEHDGITLHVTTGEHGEHTL